MKSVLISINPKWCELIASGKKTIEVRKTMPKLDTPFKCYIYCTKSKYVFNLYDRFINKENEILGKVIGEFVCKKIDRIVHCGTSNNNITLKIFLENFYVKGLDYEYISRCNMSHVNLERYSCGGDIYGWHISDLKMYDEPKELSEFFKPCKYGEESEHSCWQCGRLGYSVDFNIDCKKEITRPPQSWCYVEERI